jgi:hypothetical protein
MNEKLITAETEPVLFKASGQIDFVLLKTIENSIETYLSS